jgi:hypothetical protein
MWRPDLPDKTELLRQGDLLDGFYPPKLTLPFSYARSPEDLPRPGQPIVLSADKMGKYLVVSQCCTIEQRGVVALARVSKVSAKTTEQLDALALEEPSRDPNTNYSFNMHPLDPVEGYLENSIGVLHAADLTTIQTYSKQVVDLQNMRVAAMTPAGRRRLRIRLQFFWGRVEAEDESWFREKGLPAGPKGARTPPTSYRDGP